MRIRIIGAIALAAGAVLSLGWLAAENHAASVEARSALLASEANRLSDEGNYAEALLMAAQADPAASGDAIAGLLRPEGFEPARNALVRAYTHNMQLHAFIGHKGAVLAAVLSPDGRLTLTGGADGTARLWDAETGAERAVLRSQTGPVTAVAFSPDGKSALVGGQDEFTARISVPDGKELARFRAGEIFALAFAPGGAAMTAGTSGVKLWPAEGGEPVVLTPDAVTAAAFSADGQHVLAATIKYEIGMWALTGGEPIRRWKSAATYLRDLAVSPAPAMNPEFGEAMQFLTGSPLGVLEEWFIDRPERRTGVKADIQEVRAVAYSADGITRFFSGTDGVVKQLDPYGNIQRAFAGHDGPVNSIVLSRDGKRLLTASEDGSARLWAVPISTVPLYAGEATPLWRVGEHGQGVFGIATSPDSKAFAAADAHGTIRVRGVADGKLLATFPVAPRRAFDLAFSADGKSLLAALDSGEVVQWSLSTGKQEASFRHKNLFAMSPDGKTVLAGKELSLWPSLGGKEIARFADESTTRALSSIVISKDSRLVAAAAGKDGVTIWRATGGAPLARIADATVVRSMAFSPDGKYLAIGGYDGPFSVWTVSGKLSARFDEREIVRLAFAPDGRHIMTVGVLARLWPAGGRAALATFRNYAEPPLYGNVQEVAITPDGKTLLTGAMWGFIEAWPFPSVPGPASNQMQLACRKLAQIGQTEFSQSEYVRFPDLGRDAAHPCRKTWAEIRAETASSPSG